jgi:hypothetical protein
VTVREPSIRHSRRTASNKHSSNLHSDRLTTALRVMNYQKLCDQIFSVDKRIRYVTVTDSQCRVLAGGMRPGVVPLEHTPEEAEKIDLQVTVLDGSFKHGLSLWDARDSR